MARQSMPAKDLEELEALEAEEYAEIPERESYDMRKIGQMQKDQRANFDDDEHPPYWTHPEEDED